jgi:hypothetical protein
VFVSHTLPELDRYGFDFDKYFRKLKDLPEKFQPLTICIQMHDVNKGMHIQLRKHNLPMVTLGNSNSPYYADRFYDLARRFKYATSNVVGSQLFYCAELGVSYFLFGEETLEKSATGEVVNYYSGSDPDLVEKVKKLFTLQNLGSNMEKDIFLTEALGLDVDDVATRDRLRILFLKDFLTLWPTIATKLYWNAWKALTYNASRDKTNLSD